MKYKMTVNKTKLYNLARDFWPDWYHFPKSSECILNKITPYHYDLQWSGLRITLMFFAGQFFLRYHDAIFTYDADTRFTSQLLVDRQLVKVQ